jgi:hypothetical protein
MRGGRGEGEEVGIWVGVAEGVGVGAEVEVPRVSEGWPLIVTYSLSGSWHCEEDRDFGQRESSQKRVGRWACIHRPFAGAMLPSFLGAAAVPTSLRELTPALGQALRQTACNRLLRPSTLDGGKAQRSLFKRDPHPASATPGALTC